MRNFIDIPDDTQIELSQLLNNGRMYSAWKLAEPLGPLREWRPGNPLRLAAWITTGAGNDRLSATMDWINWRNERSNPERAFWALYARLRWKPPVILLPEIERRISSTGDCMNPDLRSDYLSLKAWALASLRDFPAAGRTIHEALAITPQRSWTHVQHSLLLEMNDRYEEALKAALHAVELRPVYRPAVIQAVDCLVHLNRDDEAVKLLHLSHRNSEQGAFMVRLQAIHSEREEHSEALTCLDEIERLMPMMPNTSRQWLAGRRADFLYMTGDIEGSLKSSDLTEESSYRRKAAANLRRPDAHTRMRKRLEVPFTRQHNMTCAPATLSSLARYWNRNHDHLEIAAAICDEGTPWHKEREWAEAHGFIAREFRFNREILITLIDRGIPFTLTTSWSTGAHLQACIGYDDRQESVILRDPTHRHFGEIQMNDLIASHPTQGPRCMLIIPHEEAHRLERVALPDEPYYDAYHQMALAIENHDRWAAESAVSTLRALDNEHPLTLSAEASLLRYLGHHEKQLRVLKRLIDRYPDHEPLQYLLGETLRLLGEQTSRRQLLQRMAAIRGADPAFISDLGELLLEDARNLPLAGHFLRRSLRLQRSEGRMLENLARYQIKLGDFHEAARLRRFASTLSPNYEPYAIACFESFRSIGKISEGLEFLRKRAHEGGRKKFDSWLSLAQALDSINHHADARATLEEAIRLMPDDGGLRLKAGRMMLFWGKDERHRGLEWIDQAKDKVPENVWLRERAWAAGALGDRPTAIHYWKVLLAREPLAIDAYQTLARLIAEESGTEQAVRFLKEATAKNPRHPGLWMALADWLNHENPAASLPALNRALELDPDDVWTLRQRAERRFSSGDRPGGLMDAREAVERAPMAAESHGVLASLLHRSGESLAATASLREAIRLRVDYPFALENLIHWSTDPASLHESLSFITAEMDRQVSNGECVTTYQQAAWTTFSPDALLENLRGFCAQRPDLWQTWAARIDQCLGMDKLDEARECVKQLKESFPLLPHTWVEAARIEKAAGDHAAQAEALGKAVDLSPAWDLAVRQLGEVLERLGRYDEACSVLKRAINFDPLNAPNHGCLADLLYKMGRANEAFTTLLAAMDACPFYQWGWTTLAGWATQLDRLHELETKIQTMDRRFAGNANWQSIVVNFRLSLGHDEQALQVARTGLEITPDHSELRDQLASILCRLERYDEALDACSPASPDVPPKRELLGRRAWVLMQSGDGPSAINLMKSVLERDPDYVWGWHQLAIWLHDRQDWSQLADAARQWVRLSPDHSLAHGFSGLAALELGEPENARRAFERAFRIDPEYQFAGRQLLNLQISSKEFEAAQTTLATLRHYAPGTLLDCDAVSLALARGWEEYAFSIAGDVILSADSPVTLQRIQQMFDRPGHSDRWKRTLDLAVREGRATSPVQLAAWACLPKVRTEVINYAKRLRKLNIPEESRNAAWDVLLRSVLIPGNGDLLKRWIRRNRKRFMDDPRLWNTVGEILLLSHHKKEVVRWFSGWQQREADVGAHTLVNLSAALDELSGPMASEPVRAAGITRFRTDDNALYLRAGQASYFASQGRLDEAREVLALVEDSRISNYYIGLASLARSIIAAAEGDEQKAMHHYHVALWKLGPERYGKSGKPHLIPAQAALARYLPWAAGKRRKVAKRWNEHPETTLNKRLLRTLTVLACAIPIFAVIALITTGKVTPLVLIPIMVGLVTQLKAKK